MTNELGHKIAAQAGDQMTLGAYRLGNRMPWATGSVIDLWCACARGEGSTGVPSPHVLFMRTRGDPADSGSMYCPECRAELAALRASGAVVVKAPPAFRPPAPKVDQAPLDLPF